MSTNENDSSGRYENKTFKSKRSNNNFAKSSKSLYYQRSKTAAEELTAIVGHH